CDAFAPCQALESGCLLGCDGDPACLSRCALNHPQPALDGKGVAGALDACVAAKCSNACGLTCGGLSQIADPASAASCSQCLQTNDCTIEEQCATDPNCATYFRCRKGCSTGDCPGACIPASGTPFFSFYTTITSACRAECDVGSNWACVGHVRWNPVPYQIRNLSFRVVDILGQPQIGATVSMCAPDDPNCATPVSGPETTGALGEAKLVDATRSSPSFGLNGFLQISGPDLEPTSLYWGFPLSMPDGVFAEPIFVFSTLEWTALWLGTAQPDPSLGAITAVALDCFGEQAPGVRFALSFGDGGGEAQLFYQSGMSVVEGPTAATDVSGVAIFLNVPPGPVDVVATPVVLGQPSSRVHVNVVAGSITEVALEPSQL
ncbi:MAG: hypothetical protein WBY94_29045, partial [Polyangiaceae bacterium]